MKINVKLVSDNAKLPHYAHIGDAGADLFASESTILAANQVLAVPTGVAIEIPMGYVGLVHPRSGMSLKGITVMNAPGTIDYGYTGEVKAILVNHTNEDYQINQGDKIAQLVIQKVESAFFEPVDELSNSVRGSGGLGSTGQ